MEELNKFRYLISLYLVGLVLLLICVALTPLLIRHGISVSRRFIVEEGTIETVLIVILFGFSFFILKAFKHTLKGYKHLAERAGLDKKRLVSRLTETFSYIGTVNVELQEIQGILHGLDFYPQSRKEFKRLLDNLAAKAMTVAGTPWVIVRIINRCNGCTVNEHSVERQKGSLPSVNMGNRLILQRESVKGFRTLRSRQKNLDILTVSILPAGRLSREQIVLITAILNQFEMYFMLFKEGNLDGEVLWILQQCQPRQTQKAQSGRPHPLHSRTGSLLKGVSKELGPVDSKDRSLSRT